MTMEKQKAYRNIAKRLYVAKRGFANDRPILILADDWREAQDKADAFFHDGMISVYPIERTKDPQIYIL